MGGKLKCAKCPFVATGLYNLTKHVRAVHEKSEDHLKCDECDMAFSRADFFIGFILG